MPLSIHSPLWPSHYLFALQKLFGSVIYRTFDFIFHVFFAYLVFWTFVQINDDYDNFEMELEAKDGTRLIT